MSDENTDTLSVPAETESADIETQVAPEGDTQTTETEATTQTETSAETPEGSDSGDDTPAEKVVPKKNSFQERINEKSRQAQAAEQRATDAEARARAAEAQIQAMQGPVGEFPTLEQFDYNQELYQKAVIEHNAKLTQRAVGEVMASQERQSANVQRGTAQRAVIDTFQERQREFAADHPDYQDVAYNPNVPLGKVTVQAAVLADNGPAIVYHLGKNPEIVAELNALPAPQAMMRIGQISAQLSQPVVPKQTQAPAPAKPPTTGSARVGKDPEKMTPIEYAQYRGYR